MKKTLVRLASPAPTAPASRRKLGTRLGVGLSLLALLGGIGLASSRPARSVGGPIPVTVSNSPLNTVTRDADNPARQPVSVTRVLQGADVGVVIYTVPAGKRLVVDYVTATSTDSNDANSYNYLVQSLQGGNAQYANFNELRDTAPFSAVSQKVELFGDPGTTVSVFVYPSNNKSTSVEFTLVGHLVDVP